MEKFELKNFQQEISLMNISQEQINKVDKFFQSYNNKYIEKIYNINVRADLKYENICKCANVTFVYDFRNKIPVIQYTLDYNIKNFNLESVGSIDRLINFTADIRQDVVEDIEKNFLKYIKYDESNLYY